MEDFPTTPIPASALAVVVPCYNVGGRARPVVERLLALVERVIVVDDGCTDGSVGDLAGLAVETVAFEKNRGKGHALMAGIAKALEDASLRAVCTMDADGQHDPAEVPRLWRAVEAEGADLAIGLRTLGQTHVPWPSRLGNRMTAACTALLLRTRLPDTQCGFRVLSRRFAEDVLNSVRPGRYETEMEIIVRAVRQGYRMSSVPIATIYEAGNPSSHFHKLRDSALVFGRLARSALGPQRGRTPPA